MNDNIILYTISLICIILLLIEWIFISHKKMLILSNFILFLPFCKAIWMYFMPLGLLFLKTFFL